MRRHRAVAGWFLLAAGMLLAPGLPLRAPGQEAEGGGWAVGRRGGGGGVCPLGARGLLPPRGPPGGAGGGGAGGPGGPPPATGLTDAERQEFYHLAEGSELFPADWLGALKSVK